MSRIGNKIITIPAGTTITYVDHVFTAKGAKGELSYTVPAELDLEIEGSNIKVVRPNDSKEMKTIHGTTRANLHNVVVGVTDGFEVILDIIGIGYRASLRGANVVLNVGHSHEDIITPFEGVTVQIPNPNEIHVLGSDKQKVGHTAALIRARREPEPYNGKGIKYRDEVIIRKEGKRAGKK